MPAEEMKEKTRPASWWVIGAAIGVAAATYLVSRRIKQGPKIWDADDLVAWCDRAAGRLDDILTTDTAQSTRTA